MTIKEIIINMIQHEVEEDQLQHEIEKDNQENNQQSK